MYNKLLAISVPLALIFIVAKIGKTVIFVEREKDYRQEAARVKNRPNSGVNSTEVKRLENAEDELSRLRIWTGFSSWDIQISQKDYEYYATLSEAERGAFMRHYRTLLSPSSEKKRLLSVHANQEDLTFKTQEQFDEWVFKTYPKLKTEALYP